MSIYVFVGPTLSSAEVRGELDAVCLPPVAQGDVYRVACWQPRAIGIIDGYFDSVPSVWHKEILWAMSRGVHVYGSASMGALRAAELEAFGMVGVGQIFADFRSGALEDDDEVAVAHASVEHGYRPMSEAMVNIRATLQRAEREKILPAGPCRELACLAKQMFYAERTYPFLLEQAAQLGLAPIDLARLRAWLPSGQVNQKRTDAIEMLRYMRQHLEEAAPKQVDFHLEHTLHWDEAMRLAGASSPAREVEATSLTTDALLDEVRLQGTRYRELLQGAQRRTLALKDARWRGWQPSPAEVAAHTQDFCALHDLLEPARLESWLQAHHLTQAQFEALMYEETLKEQVLAAQEAPSQLIDLLRVEGNYQDLWMRATDKQRRLQEAGVDGISIEAAGLTVEGLLEWYFQRLHRPVPGDQRRYARLHGFENSTTLLQAILREYCYLRLVENATGDGASCDS